MNILMSALHPEGGIRTFFRYIYGQPVFSGHTFDLIAPDRELSRYLDRFLPEQRIRVIVAEKNKVRLIRQIRAIAREGRYDIIHSHGFSAGLLTEMALTGLGMPHLMTAHDVFLPAQFHSLRGKMKKVAMNQLFRRMTAIHAVSEDARRNLLSFFPGIHANRIRGILHGVDTIAFRDCLPAALRPVLGLEAEVPLIGFFGRFMGQKGFRLLVDAMDDIVRNGRLPVLPHVVTFGWNGYIREDYEYLRDKGLGEYFHQHEQTHEVGPMLKAVDLVAMPSRWEACGLLAMEALSAAVPIVGSDCIGLREVLAGSPAQMFPAGDASALSDLLVSEINHLPERRGEFVRYQSEAVARFDLDRAARVLARLYAELADSGDS